MAYQSKDGQHTFPSLSRQRLYEESVGNLKRPGLADLKGARRPTSSQPARGGQDHKAAAADHGPAKRVSITSDAGGQHRLEAELGDGTPYSSVHSDAYGAHSAAGDLLGVESGGGGQGPVSADMGA